MTQRPPGMDPEYLELEMIVVKEFAGWRADRFVSHRIPRLSRNRVQKILKTNAFDGAGKPLKPNRILKTGEIITIYKEPPDEPDVCREFGVLYEDEYFLGVDKPPMLPVHPTAKYLKNTLTALLEEQYGPTRPNLAHRLDAETSGVLLCAKTREAEIIAKGMFAKRQMQKQYVAVVSGIVTPPEGRIELPLAPNPESIVKARMWCHPDGLPALTEYRTLQRGPHNTLLQLLPRTGRQHQLRVHLSHLGYPIVGDKLYGPDQDLFLDYMQEGLTPEIIERAGHRRQALHAQTLRFIHPFTEEHLIIESPIPLDFAQILEEA